MAKKTTGSDIQRICASFTAGQIKLIQKVVEESVMGNNKTKVVEQIVLKYLDDHHYRN